MKDGITRSAQVASAATALPQTELCVISIRMFL